MNGLRWATANAGCLLLATGMLLCPAPLLRADEPSCDGDGCHRGRFLDHFPYVSYLRMHWGHQEAPELYNSASHNITPRFRVFKPNCWYVDPSALYPQDMPPTEPKEAAAATPTPPANTPAPASAETLPPPKPLPPGPTPPAPSPSKK